MIYRLHIHRDVRRSKSSPICLSMVGGNAGFHLDIRTIVGYQNALF